MNGHRERTLSSAPRARQRGVGLVEVLIAVVLVSIGFLAAARMQVEGMRFSQSAYFQSQANLVAGDMIDRMRANTTGVTLKLYDGVDTNTSVEDPGCASKACDASERAQQDIFDWRTNFAVVAGASTPLMPGTASTPARGQITRLDGSRFRVTVSWSEVVGGAETTQNLNVFFVAESS